MGLMDRAMAAATGAAQQGAPAGAPPVSPPVMQCSGDHYVTEVNKGSINMGRWQSHLNDMFRKGYRLAHVLEQDGNTVQVYEHYRH